MEPAVISVPLACAGCRTRAAAEYFLTGETFGAAGESAQIGLLTRAVPAGDLDGRGKPVDGRALLLRPGRARRAGPGKTKGVLPADAPRGQRERRAGEDGRAVRAVLPRPRTEAREGMTAVRGQAAARLGAREFR